LADRIASSLGVKVRWRHSWALPFQARDHLHQLHIRCSMALVSSQQLVDPLGSFIVDQAVRHGENKVEQFRV
jgi:hypothetical protein